MEIRILRYFLEVAREGSVTHAAERLHISRPTLSKQFLVEISTSAARNRTASGTWPGGSRLCRHSTPVSVCICTAVTGAI